ncbi:MAG: hypothetical protein ACRES6_05810 [Steroidobacteraceae bacterium]
MSCARQIAFSGPLLSGPPRRAAWPRLALLILAVYALRALVPIGFMPADNGSLSLTICTDGFPPALLPEHKTMQDGNGMPMPQPHHRGHGDTGDGDAYCAFTMGFSSAPPPLLVVAFALLLVCLGLVLSPVAVPAGIRLVHVPQARAPPAFA